jgi:hypothetical protein
MRKSVTIGDGRDDRDAGIADHVSEEVELADVHRGSGKLQKPFFIST